MKVTILRSFSWQCGINHFVRRTSRHQFSSLPARIYLSRPTTTLNRDIRHPADLSCCVPPSRATFSTGILACFPSTTPFGLALGADSPCADERCAGTLGLSARRIFTPFIVTHVSIRTSDTSSTPYGAPSQAYRTLPYQSHKSVTPQLR